MTDREANEIQSDLDEIRTQLAAAERERDSLRERLASNAAEAAIGDVMSILAAKSGMDLDARINAAILRLAEEHPPDVDEVRPVLFKGRDESGALAKARDALVAASNTLHSVISVAPRGRVALLDAARAATHAAIEADEALRGYAPQPAEPPRPRCVDGAHFGELSTGRCECGKYPLHAPTGTAEPAGGGPRRPCAVTVGAFENRRACGERAVGLVVCDGFAPIHGRPMCREHEARVSAKHVVLSFDVAPTSSAEPADERCEEHEGPLRDCLDKRHYTPIPAPPSERAPTDGTEPERAPDALGPILDLLETARWELWRRNGPMMERTNAVIDAIDKRLDSEDYISSWQPDTTRPPDGIPGEPRTDVDCARCGKPVGNTVFTVCDDCWTVGFEAVQQDWRGLAPPTVPGEPPRMDPADDGWWYDDAQEEWHSADLEDERDTVYVTRNVDTGKWSCTIECCVDGALVQAQIPESVLRQQVADIDEGRGILRAKRAATPPTPPLTPERAPLDESEEWWCVETQGYAHAKFRNEYEAQVWAELKFIVGMPRTGGRAPDELPPFVKIVRRTGYSPQPSTRTSDTEVHLREALGVARTFVESEAKRRASEGQNNEALKVLMYIDDCPALHEDEIVLLRQALAALEQTTPRVPTYSNGDGFVAYNAGKAAIAALREHLEPTTGFHEVSKGTNPRALHLQWNGTEWVDARCGCRYHPDDDKMTHGGGPHVHPCERHAPQPTEPARGAIWGARTGSGETPAAREDRKDLKP